MSLQPHTTVTPAHCHCRNTVCHLGWMLPHCTKAVREGCERRQDDLMYDSVLEALPVCQSWLALLIPGISP